MKFRQEFKESKTIVFFIGAAVVLFILNILYGVTLNRMLAIILGLFISFSILNYIYEIKVTDRLQFEIIDREIRKYKGQEDVLRIKVVQDGWLPILGASLMLYAGDDIRFKNDISTGIRHHSETKIRFTLMPGSSIIIEVPFTAFSRGVSKIVKSEIEIPELFGFGAIKFTQAGRVDHEIIIYPDRLAVKDREMTNQINQGLSLQKNALFSDPMITTGTRDYHQHDTLRDIHWKASARTEELKTKVYEKTTRLSLMMLINLRSENSYAPPRNIEEIFEMAAHVTGQATQENIPYSVMANMATFDKNTFFKLDQSTGSLHYKKTLETLARINTLTFTVSFDRFLRHLRLHEDMPTHLIFTGVTDPEIDMELAAYKAKGVKIFQLDDHGVVPYEHLELEGAVK